MMLTQRRLLLAFVACLLLLATDGAQGAKNVAVITTDDKAAEAAVAVAKDSAMMGKLFPIVSRLFQRRTTANGLTIPQIFKAVTDLIDERELAIFATIGWIIVPISHSIHDFILSAKPSRRVRGWMGWDGDDKQASAEAKKPMRRKFEYVRSKLVGLGSNKDRTGEQQNENYLSNFEDTATYQVVNHISQASRIGFSVIAVDVISLIARMYGYNPYNAMEHAPRLFTKAVYSRWLLQRLCSLKHYLLRRSLRRREGSDLGKMNVINNLADLVFRSVWLLYLLNCLEVQTGIAIKSLFSIGATGTLVFGLASKDLASQIMGGLALHLSDKMFEGDDVLFSDGTKGKIVKMGWMETMVRSSDELVVGIPNTQLSGQRIYNLSRTPKSQVKQEVRISYEDAEKIPKFLENIKAEIRNGCPKLITDGSRAFRAYWESFEKDHLRIVVDSHFTIKPTGDEYNQNRQKVMEAIYYAAKKSGVHLKATGLDIPCTK